MTHWHVQRHAEDDDVFVTEDFVEIFQYAAEALALRAEHEYEGVSAHGEAGAFEQAYHDYQAGERYALLSDNAGNIYRQGASPIFGRAPLYRNEKQQGPLWRQAADDCLNEIIEQGPKGFDIWDCDDRDCGGATS